jgi:hypothetical protein
MGLSLVSRLRFAFIKRTYRTYSRLLEILQFALHTGPLSVQASQSIMSSLRILRYNGSLGT